MGMYTGFRGYFYIRHWLIKPFKEFVVDAKDWESFFAFRDTNEEEINKFCKLSRKEMLLTGYPEYMPKDWVKLSKFNELTGRFDFCSGIKNHDEEIETFIFNVLPYIVNYRYELELLYEEDWGYDNDGYSWEKTSKFCYKSGLTIGEIKLFACKNYGSEYADALIKELEK